MAFSKVVTPGHRRRAVRESAEMVCVAAQLGRGACAIVKSCLRLRYVEMGSTTIATGWWTTTVRPDVQGLKPVMEPTRTAMV